SVPRTPRVTTLPSATAGELRGPAKPIAGPSAPFAAYWSFQTSFPVAASRQRSTSCPSSSAKTNSLSPTSAGVATPSPTVTDHFFVSSRGQAVGATNPVAFASRLGPRHCGQSWAPAPLAPSTTQATTAAVPVFVLLIAPMTSSVFLFVA